MGLVRVNRKLEIYKAEIIRKKVAVLGMGISNTPLIEYLCKLGVDVTVFDIKEGAALRERIASLKAYPIRYSLGRDYLKNLKGFDVIF